MSPLPSLNLEKFKPPWYTRWGLTMAVHDFFYPEYTATRFCFKCRRFTTHVRCENDSRHGRYCIRCCDEDVEGDREMGYYDVYLCPRCEKENSEGGAA